MSEEIIIILVMALVATALACFLEYLARRPVKSTDDHSGGADVG